VTARSRANNNFNNNNLVNYAKVKPTVTSVS